MGKNNLDPLIHAIILQPKKEFIVTEISYIWVISKEISQVQNSICISSKKILINLSPPSATNPPVAVDRPSKK